MSLMVIRAGQSPAPEQSPIDTLLDAIGLTEMLPERLTQDASGQRFEPVQLNQGQELLRQLALLLRREPVGGAESQIRDNQRRLQGQLLDQLNRALAGAAAAPRALLLDLTAAAQTRKERMEQRCRQVEQTYARIQDRLHRWQDHAAQRSGSLVGDMVRWLVGGRDRLSAPEVIALWNERETQALQRAALTTALEMHTWFLATIADLLGRLDELLLEARRLRAMIGQELEQLRLLPAPFAPWTMRLDPRTLIAALVAQVDPEALVAELLRWQHETGQVAALPEQVRTLAHRLATQHLELLSIVDLIELEAGMADLEEGDDSLLLIGRELLATLERPIWQLRRGARPRTEILQITPDGAPIYSLDGASSAAYGAADRLGFVQVQLGVATDDLVLMRDGEEAFRAILQQRNLYVLEELAQAAVQMERISEELPELSTNGVPDSSLSQ